METPISPANSDLPTIEDRTTSLLEPQIPSPQYEIQQEEHETKELSTKEEKPKENKDCWIIFRNACSIKFFQFFLYSLIFFILNNSFSKICASIYPSHTAFHIIFIIVLLLSAIVLYYFGQKMIDNSLEKASTGIFIYLTFIIFFFLFYAATPTDSLEFMVAESLPSFQSLPFQLEAIFFFNLTLMEFVGYIYFTFAKELYSKEVAGASMLAVIWIDYIIWGGITKAWTKISIILIANILIIGYYMYLWEKIEKDPKEKHKSLFYVAMKCELNLVCGLCLIMLYILYGFACIILGIIQTVSSSCHIQKETIKGKLFVDYEFY